MIEFAEVLRRIVLILATILSPAPKPVEPAVESKPELTGLATWYRHRVNEAAAGPHLRRLLGPRWRGQFVRVCSNSQCIRVRLTDWCACGPRNGKPTLIDLDIRSFGRLSHPSRGVIFVEVSQ